MDPMVRSRRGASAQGEPETEATGAQLERDYQTALGQADPGMNPREVVTSVVPGEASPGTLEQGGAGGGVESLPLPTASPFHSERVRDQVELLRKRPADLDYEQARVEAERLGPSGVLEPDYSTAFGTNPDVGPRVARVEAVGPSVGTASEAAVTGSGSGPIPGVRPVPVDKAGPESGLQSGIIEGVFTSPEDDTPELLPDNDRTARLEQVVSQLVEENRSLRRRVEQAEWRSHSSYHSGTPGEAAMTSPVSFAVNEGHVELASSAVVCGNWWAQAASIGAESNGDKRARAAAAQAKAKGIEETGTGREALVAEAAKILKSVTLKPLRVFSGSGKAAGDMKENIK
ncbi:unnamed protein product, partial [Symbiodinium necroappetens]